MTGYCMPQSGSDGCTTPAKWTFVGAAVKAAADADSAVTFVDGANVCGGSTSTWGNKRYFADAIHLNNQGYCKMFTQPKVQEFFGCEDATYDCESLTCDISGYGSHSCGNGEMTACDG